VQVQFWRSDCNTVVNWTGTKKRNYSMVLTDARLQKISLVVTSLQEVRKLKHKLVVIRESHRT
jgi:hypothetical protein